MSNGILLVNLGTPDSPSPKDVRRYLIEFLTDGRVIDLPWWKRQLLVRSIIIPRRYKQSALSYQEIWTSEGSPLLSHSLKTRLLLGERLGSRYRVEIAMRYRVPSIQEGIQKLIMQGVEKITVIPQFPHYASATTGSVHQKVMEELSACNVIPEVKLINNYCEHPSMIAAFCARAKQYDLGAYDHFLFSFHGLPENQVRKANPAFCLQKEDCCKAICPQNRQCYSAQCHATAKAIAKGLFLRNYTICFQSRLGKDPWLQPYASDTLKQLAEQGIRNLLVFSPSFVCDCLETLYEIGVEYAHEFKSYGGKKLHLVEGLNNHPDWIEALASLAE